MSARLLIQVDHRSWPQIRMGKPTYLQRRNGIYYVFRKVPVAARLSFGKQYVRRSLRTSDYSIAKARLRDALQDLEKQFSADAGDKVDHGSCPHLMTKQLSEVIEVWISDRSVRWFQSMKDEVGFVMPVVLRFIGKKPVTEISRPDVRAMRDKVSRLPKNFTKLSSTRNRSIDMSAISILL
jgi:hypothetical protein